MICSPGLMPAKASISAGLRAASRVVSASGRVLSATAAATGAGIFSATAAADPSNGAATSAAATNNDARILIPLNSKDGRHHRPGIRAIPSQPRCGRASAAFGAARFRTTFVPLLLGEMRGQHRTDQGAEARGDLLAARGVVQFHALALAADQTGLAQRLEVLGKRGLGNRPRADLEEGGAGLCTISAQDLRQDVRPHRIIERMQYALNSDVI